jgi:hypothetical protein
MNAMHTSISSLILSSNTGILQTRSSIKRQKEWDMMFTDQWWFNRGMHRGQHSFPESTIDHWSKKFLDHVWSISRPVGWHAKGIRRLGIDSWLPEIGRSYSKMFRMISKRFWWYRKCFGERNKSRLLINVFSI